MTWKELSIYGGCSEMNRHCKDCIRWKPLSWSGKGCFACHFMLETGQMRRKDKKGRCLEFQKSLDKSKKG